MTIEKNSAGWAFTINGDYESENYDKIFEHENVCYIVAGVEKGKENGRWHAQGFLQLVHSREMSWVKRKFITNPHLEIQRASASANIRYCTKDDKDAKTWGEPRLHGGKRCDAGRPAFKQKYIYMRENLDESKLDSMMIGGEKRINELRLMRCCVREEKTHKRLKEEMLALENNDYQNRLEAALEQQTKRQLLWAYDKKGGAGKTTYVKKLIHTKGAMHCAMGRTCDMMETLSNQLDDGNAGEICCIDIPKSQYDDTAKTWRCNYQAIEQIIDGFIAKTKYNSKMNELGSVKVIITANFPPDQTKMTGDRWVVLEPLRSIHDAIMQS